MKYIIPRIPSVQFYFERWRGGSIKTLGIQSRYLDITSGKGKRILKKHAVGYCPGEKLPCRPRENETAVMFFYEGRHFWTHLRNNEFNEVFKCD